MSRLGNIKVTVVGAGYVGASMGVLFSQHNDVTVYDTDKEKVDKINKNLSPIADKKITYFLSNKNLNIKATSEKEAAYVDADLIIIATPTNYDSKLNSFDTSSVDSVINDVLKFNKKASIVIKSTVPIGYTKNLNKKLSTKRIFFSPEFLREGMALEDNLYPSRIIIGTSKSIGKKFASLLIEAAEKKDIQVFFMESNEAEAVKLFSNSYLAMRVSFFNELDSFALTNNLNTKDLINGVCADYRISDGYNNPSFGYGGYCLPKDTKQLLNAFKDIPQSLIKSIVDSNKKRKLFISDYILKQNPKVVGIFRLVMKKGSDNFRESAIIDIINVLRDNDVEIIIYEPLISSSSIFDCKLINDIKMFKELSQLILSNRMEPELKDVSKKVFTRDIFGNN